MKRRSLLRSIIVIPAVSAAAAQQDLTPAREKELPAGPLLVPPGIGEMPNTPVATAAETATAVIRTFNPEQLSALTKLGELIAPPWDGKPGAREAEAAQFLDFLVGCSPQGRIELYRSGLDGLNQQAREKFGKSFAELNPVEADAVLAPLRQPWTWGSDAFLLAAKNDLLQATVNSRPYIDAVAETRRPRNASRFYWFPIE